MIDYIKLPVLCPSLALIGWIISDVAAGQKSLCMLFSMVRGNLCQPDLFNF